MTQKSFEAASEAEAQQLADEWIKSHPGITIRERRIGGISISSGEKYRPIPTPDRWLVTVEYDDPN